MRAYLATIGDELATLLENVEGTTDPVSLAEVERSRPGTSGQLRQAYYQLAMSCSGPALGVIKAVEKNNGLEAWRRLHQRYEPEGGARLQNMMTRILNPGQLPEAPQEFEAALVAWESLIEKWETQTVTDLSEQVKVSILSGRAPQKIRGFIQLQGITEYAKLREILISYFLSQRSFL